MNLTRQSAATIPDLKPWFLTFDDLGDPPLEWSALFEAGRPVEVEVGSGRGLFLVTAATARPDTSFLGIELDYKEGRRAARRLKKRALPNARILGGDARVAFETHLRDASAAAVHVYFPDPWWKRRHKKRRIFSSEFVAQIGRVLRPGGILHAWTDVAEYFGVMREVVAACPDFLPLVAPGERPASHDMDYHTSLERKKRKAGLPIYRARWERR